MYPREISYHTTNNERLRRQKYSQDSRASSSRTVESWEDLLKDLVEPGDLSKGTREAMEWLQQEREKKEQDSDFEKGLLNREDTRNYVENILKKGTFNSEDHTNPYKEDTNRSKEIISLSVILSKIPMEEAEQKSVITALNTMLNRSSEIVSYTGHIYGRNSWLEPHIKEYKNQRTALLQDYAQALALSYSSHTGDKAYDTRENEIDNLCRQTGETRDHILFIKMHRLSTEINSYGKPPYGAGEIIEAHIEEYKEARELWMQQFYLR